MADICDVCRQSLTDALSFDSQGVPVYEHQPNFAALIASAQDGCKTCDLFRTAVLRGVENDEDDRWRPEKDPTPGFEIWPTWRRTDPECGPGHAICSYFSFDIEQGSVLGNTPTFRVQQINGSLPSLAARDVKIEVDFALASQWISDCAQRHDKCSQLEDQYLPTRLIDVGMGDQEPRLVHTNGQRGKYVALSHCWGTTQRPVTQKLDDLYIAIPRSKLLKTFRDAVDVVRSLNIGTRYLWIDYYCIIQGDQTDFERECAKMYTTFSNAAVTICGPRALDTNAGFLYERNDSGLVPNTRVDIELTIHGQLVSISIAEEMYEVTRASRKDLNSNLSRRAWIVQERLLSPRVLYFSAYQMYMECSSADFFENLSYPVVPKYYPQSKASLMQTETKQLLAQWQDIVTEYCMCDITDGNDRLPALSGTASWIKDRIHSEYHAGLWRSNFVVGLAWHRMASGRHRIVPSTQRRCRIPASVTSPSWSWVGCEYGVAFFLSQRGTQEAFVEIVEVSTPTIGSNRFGQVSGDSANLVLRSICRHAVVSRDILSTVQNDPEDSDSRDWAYSMDDASELRAIGKVDIDSPFAGSERLEEPNGDGGGRVLLLLLAAHWKYNVREDGKCPTLWTSLVLQPFSIHNEHNEQPRDVYRRIGLLRVFNGDGSLDALRRIDDREWNRRRDVWNWMSSGEQKTVTVK